MFNSLSDRLQDTLDKLRGKGRLTEDDINVAMREIRMALLEADVNYRVVKDFVATCKELAFYDTGITPVYGDKLLCLSTCEYTIDNGRFVVAAVRIT